MSYLTSTQGGSPRGPARASRTEARSERHLFGRDCHLFNCGRLDLFHLRCAEKLHASRYDLGALSLAAVVLDFELPRAEPTFNVDLPSLLQIMIAGFCQLPECNDLMPLYPFLLLALLIGE